MSNALSLTKAAIKDYFLQVWSISSKNELLLQFTQSWFSSELSLLFAFFLTLLMRIDSLLVVERAKEEEERVVIVLQQNTNLPIIMRWGLVRFQSKLIIYYEYLKVNILHTHNKRHQNRSNGAPTGGRLIFLLNYSDGQKSDLSPYFIL